MIELLVEIKLTVLALYAGLGVVFAVAFHAGGLQRMDAGARGAGVLFRLLITPGVVALWPVLAWRWLRGSPAPTRGPLSARSLRAFHRRLVVVLAILVPLVAGAGIWLRPARPVSARGGPVAPQPARLPEKLATYESPFEGLPVRAVLLGDERGRTQLELAVAEDLEIPALLVYWVPGDAADFPREAVLLGPVWGPGARRFDLPAGTGEGRGTFVLYSVAHRERVASFAWE